MNKRLKQFVIIVFLASYIILYYLCQLIIEPHSFLEAVAFPMVILIIAAAAFIILRLIYDAFIYPIICYFFPPKER